MDYQIARTCSPCSKQNPTFGFADGANIGTEYTYDANGNMKTDANKGLTDITYNYLNLPTQITTANGNISYIYDAAGGKLRKVVNETGVGTTTTDYAGNYIYENSSLKFFSHPEGYVDTENGNKYVYQYKDHLGNVRLSYLNIGTTGTPNLEIQEENNYYPFGLKQKGYNNGTGSYANIALKRKFNGIELEQGLGVNLYEMDLRKYDPTLARWTGIDPVTHHTMSTYNAFDNNPVFWVDPSGADSQQAGCNTCDVFGSSTVENGRYITASERRKKRKAENEGDSNESQSKEEENNDCCPVYSEVVNELDPVTVTANNSNWSTEQHSGVPEYWTSPFETMAEFNSVYGTDFGDQESYAAMDWLMKQQRSFIVAAHQADFYAGREQMGRDVIKLMGVITLPVNIAEIGAAGFAALSARIAARAAAAKTSTTALTKFYPANNGFLGAAERQFLMPGQQISRFGSNSGKFFSPVGTPLPMRALPPGANTSIYNTFKVLKPFEVQAGRIAPAFGQPGLGTQYFSPVSVDVLLKRGIIGY